MFGYVPGGYARVLDVFADRLRALRVDVRAGVRVEAIERVGDAIEVRSAGGQVERYDEVVVTVASPLAAEICRGFTDDEYKRLRGARYEGIVCVSLLLRKPLSGYYLTYLSEHMPFTAVVEMSAFVDRAQLQGWSLVYLPKYVDPDDPLFELTDQQILDEFLPSLSTVYPQIAAGDIATARVSRARYVFAVPTVGFTDHLPPMRTSQPGIHLVSTANIANGTLNVDETVALAEHAVREVLAEHLSPVAHPA
jgi:protoporphyrinogen oxidase